MASFCISVLIFVFQTIVCLFFGFGSARHARTAFGQSNLHFVMMIHDTVLFRFVANVDCAFSVLHFALSWKHMLNIHACIASLRHVNTCCAFIEFALHETHVHFVVIY